MNHDYTKRGYLLPEGCKDLNDVLERKRKRSNCFLPTQFVQLPKSYGPMLKPLKRGKPNV